MTIYDDEYCEVDDFLGNLITNISNNEVDLYENKIAKFNLDYPDFKDMIYIDRVNVTNIYGNNISSSTSSLRYKKYDAWDMWNKLD